MNYSKFAKRGLAAGMAARFEGHSPGRLNLHDGEQPRSPDVTADQQVLATVYFRSPVFVVDDAGAMTAYPMDARPGFISAMPEWARVFDCDGEAWFDVSVGLPGSEADLVLDYPIRAGEPVQITKCTVSF